MIATQHNQQPSVFALGEGSVTCDTSDGTPIRVEHPAHPGATFLLDERDADWHHSPFHWGKGFLISDAGSARWDMPDQLDVQLDAMQSSFSLLAGVALQVVRQFGERWIERYTFTNQRDLPLTIGSLAISTPFRDVYHSAKESLSGNCHAHIWTGGSHSYIWAIPMSGRTPALGLKLTRGELWAYSIESRNPFVKAHNRGHIYLHATDAARAPLAFGGQQTIKLAPQASYTLEWQLGWFSSFGAFGQAFPPPFRIPTLAVSLGEPLHIRVDAEGPLQVVAPGHVELTRNETGNVTIRSATSGVAHIDLDWGTRRARTAVLFHHPLRVLVERRVRFILERQRADTRDSTRRGAFLPYDNRWNMPVNGANWLDWSDARERLAMPRLIQEVRRRNWMDGAELDAALADFDQFAASHLVDAEGSVFEHSFDRSPRRLYNFPWLADFYLAQFDLYERDDDLDLACRIVERYYALGGDHFLAIGLAEVAEGAIERLRERGDEARSASIIQALLAHADHFLQLGDDLPSHEVNYEQSIVAPLVMLLLAAKQIQPTAAIETALQERLAWLKAFAGQQPHVRLRHVPIRHWDGYWFGALRQWGDTFPHYWSVLSAAVYLRYAQQCGDPDGELSAMAEAIFRANLAHYRDDGAATCAFIFPSCVDGNPAHHDDPLANDQDWALVYHLRSCLSFGQ